MGPDLVQRFPFSGSISWDAQTKVVKSDLHFMPALLVLAHLVLEF